MQSTHSCNRPAARRLSLSIFSALCVGACQGPADSPTGDTGGIVNSVPTPLHPVTVSGISSGAYMAVQTHVALSDRIVGVAAIAGGPYHCAQGNIANALGYCISGDAIEVTPLLAFTRDAARDGRIAAIENLQDARVWILHGTEDTVVGVGTSDAAADFYRAFVAPANIKLIKDVPAAHGWPTLSTGFGCSEMGGDFINACNFDAAGELLSHLYEDLGPRATSVAAENLATLDMSAYVVAGSDIAAAGFVFVPPDCRETGVDCRLHIAFHGCRQGAQFVEKRFATNVGLNEWATENRLVVLYPQIEKSLGNPQGCWDWWGYTGSDYDLAGGKQIRTIGNLINAWSTGEIF